MLVFYTIRDNSFCTQKQICDSYLLPRQTMNHVFAKLCAEGILEVSTEYSTGREKAFVLTERGQTYAEPLIASLDLVEEKAIELMGAERIHAMTELVQEFDFPMVTSLTFPVFFQAVGKSLKSSLLTVIRTVVLFVPLGFLFSRFGLDWFWLTFPATEVITTAVGFLFYRQFLDSDYVQTPAALPLDSGELALKPSHPGVIITIAREHGSSGKQIGKLVAEGLGIPFYYKEMVALAAHESGLDREFISNIHKNAPDVLRELYLNSSAVRMAMAAQAKIIRKIADNGSCVIVGRSADYVLRDRADVVRVFIHAPKKYRIKRVMEVYGDSPKEAKRNIRRSDKARAAYYRHISGRRWADGRHYNLSVDSSIGVRETADLILAYVSSASEKTVG